MPREHTLQSFQSIPGVGPSIARDLWDLGLRTPAQLKRKDPERLYQQLCRLRRAHIDRCMLYVFRCAHYYASRTRHDPRLLLWWNWTDEKKKRHT